MDIRLQGAMDGIMVANSLREELDFPVVFLTAHADEATLERAHASFSHTFCPECAVTFYEEAGLPDEVLAERAKGRFDL